MKMFNLYKKLFEGKDEELFYFKDEWMPTDRDWNAMIMYMNKHSNLDKIFRITTLNVDQMVRRYLVAKVIGWPKLKDYESKLWAKFKSAGIFYDEFEIINNQFIELPEIWKDFILDLEQYDKLGGVALRHEYMDYLADDIVLFNAFKYIENSVESIHFSSLGYADVPNEKVIKINFRNGSIAYVRVARWNANCHLLKTNESTHNNLGNDRFATLLQIEMAPYINGEKTDPSWVKDQL